MVNVVKKLTVRGLAFRLLGCITIKNLAEVVGFELTVPFDTTVFKTAPLDLSGTLPKFVDKYQL